MTLHDDQASKNQMVMAPKHKVFLSHSGAQKGFVEQLNLDLKQCDRHAFFDKDRGCLPIGENFPHLIFEAIQQCEVGAVVLSHEFLSTKWPMLELAEMVRMKAIKGDRMMIMPIFLGVSVEDLKDDKNIRKWKEMWEKIAEVDIRIDINVWEGALKTLNPINGLVYNSKIGEVKFREEIVKAICTKVSPYLPWDDSHVQGKSRLVKIIDSMKTLVGATHEIRVGLYGVGGIGKTTTCKHLCKHFEEEFYGKVCHVEVGTGSEMENLHMILKKFTKAQRKDLKELSLDQCRTRLKNIEEKVFLAIDNVYSDSKVIEEVLRYLEAGYKVGSILLVTARTLDQLKEVMDTNECLPMPEIDEFEAKNLFCLHANVKGEIGSEILDPCIDRCKFKKGKGDDSSHYLPLVLEVLGKHLRGSNPSTWVEKLHSASNVLNRRREKEHPVFSSFGISFDGLQEEDKDLFLDVAIFHSKIFYVDGGLYNDDGLDSPFHWNVYEWLRLVHDLRDIGEVKERLNSLKAKSLLEEVDGYERIGMHDLWMEFSLHEIELKKMENRRWVLEHDVDYKGSTRCESEFEESILMDGGWERLERIYINVKWKRNPSAKVITFTECSKVKALRLVRVEFQERRVDLVGLRELRILEIYYCKIQTMNGIEYLKNLRVLILKGIGEGSRCIIEHIHLLRKLHILELDSSPQLNELYFETLESRALISLPTRILSLDFGKLTLLRVVRINNGGFTMLVLSSKLRVLNLYNCYELVNCPGLEDISNLEVLKLRSCPKLEALPNLRKLQNLKVLNIGNNKILTEVSGLEDIIALRELNASGCWRLQSFPDLCKLTNLQKLDMTYCNMLECILGMSNLIALRVLNVNGNFLRDTIDSGKWTNLEKVIISRFGDKQVNQESNKRDGNNAHEDDLTKMDIASSNRVSGAMDTLSKVNVEVNDGNNINGSRQKDGGLNEGYGEHECVSKKGANVCSSAEPLQALDLSVLEHVSSLLTLVDIDCELTNLHKLTRLERLSISYCGFKRLPNMGNHMNLKVLIIHNCRRLESWDGVGGLKLVEPNINVKLQCSWTLAHLVTLSLDSSPFQLPDLSHFPQLIELSVGVGRVWEPPEKRVKYRGFALYCEDIHLKLQKLKIYKWPIIKVPNLSNFPELVKFSLRGNFQTHMSPEDESTLSGFCSCFQDGHVKLKGLKVSNWPFMELPDLSRFSSLERLTICDCQDLTSLTASKPLTALGMLSLKRCPNLKELPAISFMLGLRDFWLVECGVSLSELECQELRLQGCNCRTM